MFTTYTSLFVTAVCTRFQLHHWKNAVMWWLFKKVNGVNNKYSGKGIYVFQQIKPFSATIYEWSNESSVAGRTWPFCHQIRGMDGVK